MKSFIDFVYTLLIGVAVLLFVSLGVWSFYQGPKMPEFPNYPVYPSVTTDESLKQYDDQNRKAQDEYNTKFKDYEKQNKPYSSRVAMVALGAAVVFYGLGVWMSKRHSMVAEGLNLGGIFTAIYSAVRASMGDSRPTVFAAVSVLLAMSVFLVMRRTQSTKKS